MATKTHDGHVSNWLHCHITRERTEKQNVPCRISAEATEDELVLRVERIVGQVDKFLEVRIDDEDAIVRLKKTIENFLRNRQ